jgi:hypothetical protein
MVITGKILCFIFWTTAGANTLSCQLGGQKSGRDSQRGEMFGVFYPLQDYHLPDKTITNEIRKAG